MSERRRGSVHKEGYVPDGHHRLRVGDRAHRTVGEVLRRGLPEQRHDRVLLIVKSARDVLAAHPVDYRPRETLFDVTTAAGVYISRFLPEEPWEFLGAEVRCGNCRFDLVFEHPRYGVLIDELKIGRTRVDDVAVHDQLMRYLAAGTDQWHDRFAGVRLCAVYEPAESRLFEPTRNRSRRVSDSELAPQLAVR